LEQTGEGAQNESAMKPRIWPILLASTFGLVILLCLGVWQLQRLAWKEDLIAKIDARTKSPAVHLSDVFSRMGRGEDVNFTPIFGLGLKCYKGAYLRFLTSHDGLPGYRILQACEYLNTGSALMLDMGTLPETAMTIWLKQTDDLTLPDPPKQFYVSAEGVIAIHESRRGTFDPDNNQKDNLWYWWDGEAMKAALKAKLPADVDLASIIVQQVPPVEASAWPKPTPIKANLRNNHLGYAITWFGLAAVLVVMTGVFIVSRRTQS
jgi:surfeit locus 1 family protein